jgi:hypothetical protein
MGTLVLSSDTVLLHDLAAQVDELRASLDEAQAQLGLALAMLHELVGLARLAAALPAGTASSRTT